jgi:hypothetical protein
MGSSKEESMSVVPRMSSHTGRILRGMAELPPGRAVTATELLDTVGILPGIGHPIFQRLCYRGLLLRHWEDIDPVTEGRPRGCAYTLTPLGLTHSAAVAARV